ncbi:hypothetical protein IFM89_025019 [Coptis chinensis]|uniref:MATH domain-containing protein n=1 Tax=Coptis chinensis TaxID=261450 RepID=A0A835HX88_9MAGN|nr:hypothetical protein IFM89_025019 [Coptis chinensis]
MADFQSIPNDKEGTFESIRDDPPTHFTFAIQSFSLLQKCSIERYETSIFEAGGYKWKLCLFPNGNKNKNVKEHVSLYLVIAETNSLPPGWHVNVVFRFFLFDQIRDKYLTMEDVKATGKRFHAMKTEWGFDQLIALKTFNDPSNGYLVDDECVFGAEVFTCNEKSQGKGERLSMIKGATSCKNTWKIENYPKLEKGSMKECLESEPFTAGDHKWLVRLYPNGFGEGKGNSVSLYLALADSSALPAGRTVYVDFTLRFMNQSNQRIIQSKATYWFSASNDISGWQKFLLHSYLAVLKDAFTVEAEVTVMGLCDKMP